MAILWQSCCIRREIRPQGDLMVDHGKLFNAWELRSYRGRLLLQGPERDFGAVRTWQPSLCSEK